VDSQIEERAMAEIIVELWAKEEILGVRLRKRKLHNQQLHNLHTP